MLKGDITAIGDGKAGGKGANFLKVRDEVRKILLREPAFAENIDMPKTVLVTTSEYRKFVEHNRLDPLISKVERAEFRADDCLLLKEAFLNGTIPDEVKKGLLFILEDIREPLVVRSSSILEDQKGAAFAGKYESVFVGNQGDAHCRWNALAAAIKKVYSTTYNENALAYRCKRGFIDSREEMALVIQPVVGRRYGNYFLPAMAGVGFSQNGYCWNKEIKKGDGLVRLVFGLGTRSVGRGYVRLFSPVKPTMRPEGTDVNNIQKCSQKKVDVVDLEGNELKSVHFRELIKDGFNCYPGSQAMVSLRDSGYLYRPVSNMWDSNHVPVLTMDGVLMSSWMNLDVAKVVHWLLNVLEESLGFAVDLEFAVNIEPDTNRPVVYILQVRPLSERGGREKVQVPVISEGDMIFSVRGSLPTAYVPDVEYLVYVDDEVYHGWPRREKQSVARVIGKLNEALKGKAFALIGPGRWGSWNPDLGVPVSYAEISNSSILIEVARRRATYVPEVSFGSHFFQDLIEDNIAYLPVYPDEPGVIFNEAIFGKKSEFQNLLPGEYYRQFEKLIRVIRVPAAAKGKMAHAIMDGELEKAVLYLG